MQALKNYIRKLLSVFSFSFLIISCSAPANNQYDNIIEINDLSKNNQIVSDNNFVRGATNNETLNSYRSFELGEAILLLMPDKNTETSPLNWDYRHDAQIVWETDGYKTDKDGNGKEYYFRDGLIRINVQGMQSKILRKSKEELAWTIRYLNFTNPKFGVESIRLYAGDFDGQCFGTLYDNCDFELDKSLKSSNINMRKICEQKFSGDYKRVGYELSHRDKNRIFAELLYDGGSGGSSTEFEIFFSKQEKDLCKDEDNSSNTKESKPQIKIDVSNKKSEKKKGKKNDLDVCKNVSDLARSIMGIRQREVSMSKAMELANKNTIIEYLVISAYSKPSFSTEQYKENAIQEFENESYLSCIKTLRK